MWKVKRMNTARIVVLTIAIGAGGIAAYLASGSDRPEVTTQPVAQVPTVDVLVAKSDIGLGQTVKADDMQWQSWPAASANSSFISKASKADAIKEITGSIARAVHHWRTDPGAEADQGQRLRLHGGDPAEWLPGHFHRNFAGNRRRRLHPAERPRRCDPFQAREKSGRQIARYRQRGNHPDQHSGSRDRPGAEGKRRYQHDHRQDRDPRAETRAGRDAGALAPGRHDIAGAAQHHRCQHGRQGGRRNQAQRRPQRHSLWHRRPDDDPEVIERTHDMKCRDNQPMRTFIVRALSFSAVAALTLNPALTPVVASDYRAAAPVAADGQMNARFLSLGIGKSIVIDLPRDIKDVLVADPKIANAVVRSTQRAYIIGAAVGQTNIVFFDSAGQQMAAYDIAVKRDLNGIRAALKQSFPNSDIQIEGVGEGVMLSGSAASPIEAQQAGELAARLVGGPDKVVNSIAVRGRDQVMLKVTVAEVQRSIIKQLGIDLSGSLNYGTAVVNFNNTNPFTATGQPLVGNNAITTSFGAAPSVQATLRAMESAGVTRTLAEPNLTAISGETATFIAGGEFPIPTGVTCQSATAVGGVGQCAPSISFKKFGISLNFTPVVLSEGRISLRVATEVSEVSNDNSINITGISVPSIKTRRAETTLEIPSGGAMAMAGLIQEQTKQAINGLPGLSQLPVLGSLFRSQDFVNSQTELMVLVTPFIVRAVAQKDLSRPDDGFAAASDQQADLLGSINRIYGVPGRVEPARNYRGSYGFITD